MPHRQHPTVHAHTACMPACWWEVGHACLDQLIAIISWHMWYVHPPQQHAGAHISLPTYLYPSLWVSYAAGAGLGLIVRQLMSR